MQTPGRPITRFPQPFEQSAGRSAALHRLPIAQAIGRALRLASHPGRDLRNSKDRVLYNRSRSSTEPQGTHQRGLVCATTVRAVWDASACAR